MDSSLKAFHRVANSKNARQLKQICAVVQIIKAYPEKMSYDVKDFVGFQYKLVPQLSLVGAVKNEGTYGNVEMYAEGSHVVVLFVGMLPMIIGSVVAYDATDYQQEAIGDDSKQYSRRLLNNDRKAYRKILRSGTSVEVTGEGEIRIETNSGSSVVISDDGHIKVKAGENQEKGLVFFEDLKERFINPLVEKYNDLVSKFNSHIHPGSGGGMAPVVITASVTKGTPIVPASDLMDLDGVSTN